MEITSNRVSVTEQWPTGLPLFDDDEPYDPLSQLGEYYEAQRKEPRPPRAVGRLRQLAYCVLHFDRFAGYSEARRAADSELKALETMPEIPQDFSLAA